MACQWGCMKWTMLSWMGIRRCMSLSRSKSRECQWSHVIAPRNRFTIIFIAKGGVCKSYRKVFGVLTPQTTKVSFAIIDRPIARIACPNGAMSWLLDPKCEIDAGGRSVLLGQLLSSPLAIVMGSVNSLLLSVACLVLHGGLGFALFSTCEIALLSVRVLVLKRVRRSWHEGGVPDVSVPVMLSIAWCLLQGLLSFQAMQTLNLPLMVLAATLIMGIIGPICARNFSAPRLALLLVCLCDLPFKVGAALSGSPWLWLLLPMTPLFLMGAMQIVQTFQQLLTASLLAEAQQRYLADHDALTGLLNRTGLDAALVGLPATEDGVLAVLGIDLDGFKAINDTHGHAMGDLLLQAVGQQLARSVRPGDLTARIGGDEFMVVIRNMSPDAVGLVGDKLIASIADEAYLIGDATVRIGASIGYACFPEDGATVQQLRLQADAALYAAKRAGKGASRRYNLPLHVSG